MGNLVKRYYEDGLHARTFGLIQAAPGTNEQPSLEGLFKTRARLKPVLVFPTGFSKGGTNPLSFQIDVKRWLSDVVRRNSFGHLTVSGFQFNPAQLRLQHVEVRIG
jgi:hypothetical protein